VLRDRTLVQKWEHFLFNVTRMGRWFANRAAKFCRSQKHTSLRSARRSRTVSPKLGSRPNETLRRATLPLDDSAKEMAV
jgi:hypothetical protein